MKIQNERGSILFGGLVAITIVLGVLYFYFDSRLEISRIVRNRHYFKAHLDSLIASTRSSLLSQQAYLNTIRSPLNKLGADLESCLNNPAFDCPRGTFRFSVVDEAGVTLIDSSSNNNGWDIFLRPCTTFQSTLTTCVIQYEMLWTPRCPPAGACYNPEIDVTGQVKFPASPNPDVNFDPASFNSTFTLR
ncbi:MAG: hypothetical protein ACAH59_11700 [Pseudobdellovibrionaceae bacterium]